jgi:hypothetical protein
MKQPGIAHLARSIVLVLAVIGALIGLSGAALAAPPTLRVGRSAAAISHDQTVAQNPPPRLYVVVLDVTTSMSWNFAGQGTRSGKTVQCGATSDPNVQRRQCGANAPWRRASERRIFIVKQALLRFVNRLHANDALRLIAFSTRHVTANAAWVRSNAAGKTTLRRAVLDAGNYRGDRYRTAGEAPTASALYLAGQLLAQAPQTAPNGAAYGAPVVILLTDSVANNMLLSDGGWRANDSSCVGVPFREDIATCQVGYTSDSPPLARPITAMALQADQLKQCGPMIYVIALAGVDETGLKDVASAPQSPFFATAQTGAELRASLAVIQK